MTIGDTTDKALHNSDKNGHHDLSAVYNELRNAPNLTKSKQEINEANQALKKVLPDLQIVGFDNKNHIDVYNSKTNTVEHRQANNFDQVDKGYAPTKSPETSNKSSDANNHRSTDANKSGGDEQKSPLAVKQVDRDSSGHVKSLTFEDGSQVVNKDGKWQHVDKSGKLVPGGELVKAPTVDNSGVHLDHGSWKEDIAHDGTNVKSDPQGRPFEIWPQGDYSRRIVINRDEKNRDQINKIDLPNDGKVERTQDGKYVRTNKDGTKEELAGPPKVDKDGTITMTYPNGKSEVHHPDGRVDKTENGKTTTTEAQSRPEDKKEKEGDNKTKSEGEHHPHHKHHHRKHHKHHHKHHRHHHHHHHHHAQPKSHPDQDHPDQSVTV